MYYNYLYFNYLTTLLTDDSIKTYKVLIFYLVMMKIITKDLENFEYKLGTSRWRTYCLPYVSLAIYVKCNSVLATAKYIWELVRYTNSLKLPISVFV